MSTANYYKYDDGKACFQCFDISRYYSGDWAQAIQYVFRWQKKGGVKDLKKALACVKDAQANGITSKLITKNQIISRMVYNKFKILEENNFSNAGKIWKSFRVSYDVTYDAIKVLEEMISDAKKIQ